MIADGTLRGLGYRSKRVLRVSLQRACVNRLARDPAHLYTAIGEAVGLESHQLRRHVRFHANVVVVAWADVPRGGEPVIRPQFKDPVAYVEYAEEDLGSRLAAVPFPPI